MRKKFLQGKNPRFWLSRSRSNGLVVATLKPRNLVGLHRVSDVDGISMGISKLKLTRRNTQAQDFGMHAWSLNVFVGCFLSILEVMCFRTEVGHSRIILYPVRCPVPACAYWTTFGDVRISHHMYKRPVTNRK